MAVTRSSSMRLSSILLPIAMIISVTLSGAKKEEHHRPGHGGSSGPGCNGDPHFSGADSSHFDFSGVPNTTYCLMTDSHISVNAYFGGYYGQYEGRTDKSITWMREIGILWGHHTVVLTARQGADASYGNGYMAAITIDGETVTLSKPGDKATFGEGQASISWLSAKEQSGDEFIDVYAVDINGVLSAILELRPEMPQFRTETDGTVHFDIYFPVTYLSDNVHGILGQTYRSDHAKRLSGLTLKFNDALNEYVVPGDNGEGYLDGSASDYKTSSITAADSAVNRFVKMSTLDSEAAQAMEVMAGSSNPSEGVPSVLGVSASTSKMSPTSSTFKRLRRLRLMKKLKLRK